MGDGIGSATSNKQSSEDFLSLDGKVHKLDISKLVDDPNDIWSVKNIKSIERGLFNSSCDLFYEPKYQQDNVIYVVLIAFKQRVTWGRFSGHCMVEGERIEVDSWGFFEHMHMRW